MDEPQSVKPVGASRPVRRSLAEFALPAGEAPDTWQAPATLPATQCAAAMQRTQPSTAGNNERVRPMGKPLDNSREATANEPAQADSPNSPGVGDSELLRQFEDMTLAAAKAAKDYRFLMLEHMKINMTAALSYMNGLAAATSRGGAAAHDGASAREIDPPRKDAEVTAATESSVSDEYRAKAFELMTANMNVALEYAQRFARAKTPSEFVELATGQARKQLELVAKQTSELSSLAQKLTPREIAAMTSTFAKLLSERKG